MAKSKGFFGLRRFQFHKGTIKTPRLHWQGVALRDFNSIKVRLKLCVEEGQHKVYRYFNSIKVRLKRFCL